MFALPNKEPTTHPDANQWAKHIEGYFGTFPMP